MFKIAAFLLAAVLCQNYVRAQKQVVCYYDGRSSLRNAAGKVDVADIDAALPLCNYLVHGYAGISGETNKIISLNETNDLDTGVVRAFRTVTTLKKKFSSLKVLLSVGGGADPNQENYFKVLESSGSRLAFINSVYTMIKTYEFDGLDLAWQFPPIKPKKLRSSVGGFFHKLKKTVGLSSSVVDENAEAHRESFTALVRELKGAFAKENLVVALTVLPNVNASIYYDVPSIIGNVDFVVLTPFDFQTPDRNPKEADYPAPIKALNDRNPELNLEAQVGYWMAANTPASKLIVGIPVYGRVWKMTKDSGLTGVPPVTETDGPAEKGPQTEVAGMWSWPETCAKLANPGNSALTGALKPLIRTADPSKRYGTYAYRTADDNGEYGIWVGYEEPYTAGLKAKYVREKKLGGIGIFDLSLDDTKGACQGEKFQMLRAAKYRLDNDN